MSEKFPRQSLPSLLSSGLANYGVPVEPHSHTIQRLDDRTVAKIGFAPYILRETAALSFIKTHTTLPVPGVIDVWVDEDPTVEKAYLIMDWIHGEPIYTAWEKMDTPQQTTAVSALRAYVTELRALRQDVPGRIESCTGGPAMDHRVQYDGSNEFGPLASVAEFHDLLLHRIRDQPFFAEHRGRYNDDHEVKFTHADLTPKNILVDPSTGAITAILDWEMAGWWPDYWEYRKAMYGDVSELWEELVPLIMTPYPKDFEADREHEWY